MQIIFKLLSLSLENDLLSIPPSHQDPISLFSARKGLKAKGWQKQIDGKNIPSVLLDLQLHFIPLLNTYFLLPDMIRFLKGRAASFTLVCLSYQNRNDCHTLLFLYSILFNSFTVYLCNYVNVYIVCHAHMTHQKGEVLMWNSFFRLES